MAALLIAVEGQPGMSTPILVRGPGPTGPQTDGSWESKVLYNDLASNSTKGLSGSPEHQHAAERPVREGQANRMIVCHRLPWRGSE